MGVEGKGVDVIRGGRGINDACPALALVRASLLIRPVGRRKGSEHVLLILLVIRNQKLQICP